MGCATAFYLSELMSDAEEGDVSVLVVESSGEVASQASGKAGGFLASDWSTGSLGLLAQKSFELHSELADVLGAKTIGYRSVSLSLNTMGLHGVPSPFVNIIQPLLWDSLEDFENPLASRDIT